MLAIVEEKLGNQTRSEELFASLSRLAATNAQLLLTVADGYYRQKQPAPAVRLLEMLRANSQTASDSLYSAAALASAAGDRGTARRLLQELVRRGQSPARAYTLLARDYEQDGDLPHAVECFERAIALEPAAERHYLDLVRTLAAHNQWRPALDAAARALIRFPRSEPLYEAKGLSETVLMLTADAIASYTRALEINPESAKANLGLAVAQKAAGLFTQAAATFDRGIRKFPGDALHYQEYGLMLLKQEKSREPGAEARAAELLERAAALDPALSEAQYELGNIALNRRDVEAALTHLKRAAALAPETGKVHYALSRAYRESGRQEDASRELAEYRRIAAEDEKATPGFPAVQAHRK
jgi:tetratricopeptide (TPR) repeat protein